ncbi:sensor histidine kinase [Microbaculum marinisediminis]|uniref:histidine kinase n=1 Tax=Microbaculum marinisediminis TaxID=2931392 RepID=A0AAW5QYS2_9HYPH|nr:PAS domain-containing sensor histidine kinase [Microbaculum sp. A6E488]MCT8971509.1 PAS domain-containing sensor histidine kinase [Microbaculum sp. A6E488]
MRGARPVLGFFLPLGVIAILATLLVYSLIGLAQTERKMRLDASTNMIWVLSRAESASLRFAQALARSELGTGSQDDLTLRYAILLSRLGLIDEGPQRRRMIALGYEAELEQTIQAARAIEPLVSTAAAADFPHARDTAESIAVWLGRAANAAMVAEWNELGGQLDQYRDEIWQIIVWLVGIAIAGGILSAFLIHSLVVSRRRTELLYRERDFSSLLVASSGEGILAFDRNLRCTLWNDAMQRLIGWSAERAVGKTLGDISGFFAVDGVARRFREALNGTSSSMSDKALFQPDTPDARYVDMRCFPLKDDEGIIGAIAFIGDVTERHAAQRELARHRDHLEELVAARTRELIAALERERAAAELYSNFATMVSHQFRTPLAIVDSTLQRLIRRNEHVTADEMVARAHTARGAIERLTRLVESTLDAARLDAGQIELSSGPCEINALVAAVCARQREETSDREIVFKPATDTALSVMCDPAHAEHALANLVSNAVKYSPPQAPVRVDIEASPTHVHCLVHSEGDPIPDADRDKLFERYFRGRNSAGKVGIGVGLYMARALARMQGGDVELVDSGRDGTVFALVLPLLGATASAKVPDRPEG